MVLKTASNSARGRRLPLVLNDEEQAALLAAPNRRAPTGLRNYALLTLFLNLGLRVSEALDLKVAAVDWRSGELAVRAGKGNRDRLLWLAPADLEVLESWRRLRPAVSDFVFCTLKGGRMHDRYVRDFVKRCARRAGLNKDVHPHTLRHTFATDLLRRTGNIRLVQKALGHASLATTMIYTHIADEELKSALRDFRGSQA